MVRYKMMTLVTSSIIGMSGVFAQAPALKSAQPQESSAQRNTAVVLESPEKQAAERSSAEMAKFLVSELFTRQRSPSSRPAVRQRHDIDLVTIHSSLLELASPRKRQLLSRLKSLLISHSNPSSTGALEGAHPVELSRAQLPGRFTHLSAPWITIISHTSPRVIKSLARAVWAHSSLRQLLMDLAISAHILTTLGLWESESLTYRQAMLNDPFFHGPEFLERRFRGLIQRQSQHASWSKLPHLPQERRLVVSIGFWLRRHLDGSASALSQMLLQGLETIPHVQAQLRSLSVVPPRSMLDTSRLTRFFNTLTAPVAERHSSVKSDVSLISLDHLSFSLATAWGEPAPSRGDVSIWERASGFTLDRPLGAAERRRPFRYLNSDLIYWVIDHLIPNPELKLAHGRLIDIYRDRLAGPLRLLFEARASLYTLEVRIERGEYALARLSPKFDEERYLTQRYQVKLAELERRYPRISNEILSPKQAFSFWLRREIDGTGRLLWGGLIRLMTSLDPVYLRSIGDRERD